jgi:hypothetical protein
MLWLYISKSFHAHVFQRMKTTEETLDGFTRNIHIVCANFYRSLGEEERETTILPQLPHIVSCVALNSNLTMANNPESVCMEKMLSLAVTLRMWTPSFSKRANADVLQYKFLFVLCRSPPSFVTVEDCRMKRLRWTHQAVCFRDLPNLHRRIPDDSNVLTWLNCWILTVTSCLSTHYW